jgi:hypothetical protein
MNYGWVFAVIGLSIGCAFLFAAWWAERREHRPWWREPRRGDYIETRRKWR